MRTRSGARSDVVAVGATTGDLVTQRGYQGDIAKAAARERERPPRREALADL
jgi:hypothetical protein